MTWTTFWDMHSGGGTKLPPYEKIYVELPEDLAVAYFKKVHGRDPENVTCDCCGEDYSINSDRESLEEATHFHRNCLLGYFYTDTDERIPFDKISRSDVKYDYEERTSKFRGRAIYGKYVEEPDYSLMEYGSSKTECDRSYQTLENYSKNKNVLIVYKDDALVALGL